MDNIRPTSHAATAHPAPVKKPTQNQTPTRYRLTVEGILDSPDNDDDWFDNKNDIVISTDFPTAILRRYRRASTSCLERDCAMN